MKFPYKATHQRTFLLNSPITCQEGCSLDNIENLTNNVYIYIIYHESVIIYHKSAF